MTLTVIRCTKVGQLGWTGLSTPNPGPGPLYNPNNGTVRSRALTCEVHVREHVWVQRFGAALDQVDAALVVTVLAEDGPLW